VSEIPKAKLAEIVERLQQGAALIEESHGLGFTHNGPLRQALKKMLGVEGYDALMGSKRVVAHVAVDDTGVPVITKGLIKDGWNTAVTTVRGHREDVFVSPDGQRYVRAADNEKAVLIVDLTKKTLGRVRLRLEHGSRLVKAAKKEAKVVAHGEEQKKQRKAVKRGVARVR